MNRPRQSYPNLSAPHGRIVLELAVLAWMGLFVVGYGVLALIRLAGGAI